MFVKTHPKIGDPRWVYLAAKFRDGLRKLSNGCWICDTAQSVGNGYMRLTVNRKPFGQYRIGVHQFSYRLFRGPLKSGLCVCHSCDNPSCCNPEHLFLGTHAQNAEDRRNKKRGRFGEGHGNARLSKDDVIKIRRAANKGTKQSIIADRYGITQAAVSLIVIGKLWSHVPLVGRKTEAFVKPSRRVPKKCAVFGCKSKCRKGGMCLKHYRRMAATGSTRKPPASDANESLRSLLIKKFVLGLRDDNGADACWRCETADYGNGAGYGRVGVDRVGRGSLREYTHRLSFKHFKGPIPDGLVVRHSCDNPSCCNPQHLSVGTDADNVRDKIARGRWRLNLTNGGLNPAMTA